MVKSEPALALMHSQPRLRTLLVRCPLVYPFIHVSYHAPASSLVINNDAAQAIVAKSYAALRSSEEHADKSEPTLRRMAAETLSEIQVLTHRLSYTLEMRDRLVQEHKSTVRSIEKRK